MQSSMKRSLKSRQIGLVQTHHLISGTASTPADSGIDRAFVSSITDNGTGDYTITVLEPSRLAMIVNSIVGVTSKTVFNVSAVTTSTVRVLAFSDAGVAKDADFYISLIHSTLLDSVF